jgi:Flp pilus assembly protein TadG
MMPARNWLGALRGDQRGAAVMELALVAPIFATMLIGMVDIGRGYSMKLQLEQAAQRAIEKVMNGQADKTSAAALKTEAATTAGVAETSVIVDYWLECNSARQSSYDTTCDSGSGVSGGGSSGAISRRYLTVQISKTFTPMFASKWLGSNTDGTFTVIGKTGVRTQ